MKKVRKKVGYVRTLSKGQTDRNVQIKLINAFSESMGFETLTILEDMGYVKHRRKSDIEKAKTMGIKDPKRSICFPAWDDMLVMAMNDEISAIVVDRKERLYRNARDKKLLDSVLQKHRVKVFEAGASGVPREAGKENVAFYHYTVPNARKPGIRTVNLIKDIEAFYEMVTDHSDWNPAGVYIDCSADRRTEFRKLQARTDIDVIVCKHFYQLKRKSLAFLQMAREMKQKGINLISTSEGMIRYEPGKWTLNSERMRIATYDYCRSEHEKTVQALRREKIELFCRMVGIDLENVDIYEDEGGVMSNEFTRLLASAARYDAIIIDTFAKLGESVNELLRWIRQIGAPVYSLKEGMLYTDGNEGTL